MLPGQVGRGPEAPADPPSSAFFLSAALRALEAASVAEPARPPRCAPLEAGGIAQHAETRHSAWRGSKLAPSREFRRNRMWQKERLGSGPRH